MSEVRNVKGDRYLAWVHFVKEDLSSSVIWLNAGEILLTLTRDFETQHYRCVDAQRLMEIMKKFGITKDPNLGLRHG